MSRSPTAPSSPAVKRQGVDRAPSRKCEEMKLRLRLAGKEREAAEKAREEAALQLEYYQMQMEGPSRNVETGALFKQDGRRK
ncbi:hypothetical protein LTR27_007987 [Elasticomyces elasticus]|nr:hypothetical protein LTR27_007987 [Elasticomyces elasticus]